MSTMKKLKQLFIATSRSDKVYYIAKLNKDESSVIIQRVIKTDDGNKEYHTLINIIDCDSYVFTAIEINEKKYSVSARNPSAEFETEIPDEYAKYRDYYIECETPHNNALRVRLEDYDAKADVFNTFVVTRVEGSTELVVAYIDVDTDSELGAVLSGYPAGFEIADN